MLLWDEVYTSLQQRVETYGISVTEESLGDETTGTFDGLTITTNNDCDWETRCHNLAHSFGHIIQWSVEHAKFAGMYQQLAANKRDGDQAGLEQTLLLFREYEVEASEYAVWLLQQVGYPEAIEPFTNFARADIESIITFHRDGIAPVWQDFFANWNCQMKEAGRQPEGFAARPAPTFEPRSITPKRVIREVDGIA